MSEKPQRTPSAGGWKVAVIGVVIALVVGLILIWIGIAKINKGAAMQRAANAPLFQVVLFGTEQSLSAAQAARLAVGDGDFGRASDQLDVVGKFLDLMAKVTPDETRGEIAAAQEALKDARPAVQSRSEDAKENVDMVERKLYEVQKAIPQG